MGNQLHSDTVAQTMQFIETVAQGNQLQGNQLHSDTVSQG